MGGFDDRGFTAFSRACDTMLRLRSSGARAREWFCIRRRSVDERTMVILGPARTISQPQQGYHGVAQSPQDVAVIVRKTTIFLKQRRVSQSKERFKRRLPPHDNGPDRAGPREPDRPKSPVSLFFFLGLLFGRSEPFQPLEK